MKSSISPEDARAYRRRWRMMQQVERQELRQVSYLEKLLQLSALMGSVQAFGWQKLLAQEESEPRDRWNRLRKVLSG